MCCCWAHTLWTGAGNKNKQSEVMFHLRLNKQHRQFALRHSHMNKEKQPKKKKHIIEEIEGAKSHL